MVSAAGIAPAVARSQAEHVAAMLRAGKPGLLKTGTGERRIPSPGRGSCGKLLKMAGPKEPHTK